jgi:D-alanyl-D-alanine carboxypeptidase
VIPLGIPSDYGARRGLKLQAEATELVSVGSNPDGRDVRLTPVAAKAWSGMKEAAAQSGVTLIALSGFRSIERQSEIIRAKLAAGDPIEAILRAVAAPGYSEHHTGRAIDIGGAEGPYLTEDFAQTPAFRWLEAHAGEFGFTLSYPSGNAHGITYEPWHWCYQKQ